jgi:hypothetical protein
MTTWPNLISLLVSVMSDLDNDRLSPRTLEPTL